MSSERTAAHTVKDSRSSEESKQTPAVLGSRGEKPAAAVTPDASQCDSEGATGSASQSSAAQGMSNAASLSDHEHEWSLLYGHFGPYGDQDAHYHQCLFENENVPPGYKPRRCEAWLVGHGRECADGASHEVRLPKNRVRYG